MKVLLTGGAGFIGSHLGSRLLAEGHELEIVDDLNDFYAPELKMRNLTEVGRHGKFTLHHVDICETQRINDIVQAFRPDVLVHLAARAGVRPSLAQPLLYEQVNMIGTIGLLEACRKSGVRKVVFASSSSIYGVANHVPFREDDYRNLPISPYAATKLAGEKICFTYSHLYGLPSICLRLFTVYGPRQRPDLAIRKFIRMIDRGEPIPFFGDGTTARDYTFVNDTIDGIVRAIHHETNYEIFNLGNSNPVTLQEMVRTIEEQLGKRAILLHSPAQPGDVPITYADITKARALLGYNPATPFVEGVRQSVEWYRQTN